MKSNKELSILRAIAFLKAARHELREAGANKAADYVARAVKSAEGASRHAHGMATRSQQAAEDRACKFGYSPETCAKLCQGDCQ